MLHSKQRSLWTSFLKMEAEISSETLFTYIQDNIMSNLIRLQTFSFPLLNYLFVRSHGRALFVFGKTSSDEISRLKTLQKLIYRTKEHDFKGQIKILETYFTKLIEKMSHR